MIEAASRARCGRGPHKRGRRNQGSTSGCHDPAEHARENMGPAGGAVRSPVPGAALGDLPGSRAARAGGGAGRAARGCPSSLAGWPLRSQRSFRRVFAGAAHKMVRALRPPRPERVPARHAPVAHYGRAGGAPSSDLSSVLDEHVSARRRARPTDVDRPRPDARPLEGPRRVCNVVGGERSTITAR